MKARSLKRIARQPRPGSGFTLLEVLLTSLLASVVLIALWSLSDIYMRLFVSGRNKIEETQLARSLTSQLARDISLVAQRPEESRSNVSVERMPVMATVQGPRTGPRMASLSSSSSVAENGRGPGLPTSPARDRLETSTSLAGDGLRPFDDSIPRFGLFGTSDALRLIVLQIDPRTTRLPTDLSDVLPDPGRLRIPFASELRTIEYSLGDTAESTDQDQRHPAGLIRREWAWEHWIGIRAASLLSVGGTEAAEMLPKGAMGWTAEDATSFENQEYLHVPQVHRIEFSYYDGEDWDIEWNSWERGKLPVLVEVLIEFQMNSKPKTLAKEGAQVDVGEESESSTTGINRDSQGAIYRRLIHLPFANDARPKSDDGMAPLARMSLPVPGNRTRQP